jgi:hypothetical protein
LTAYCALPPDQWALFWKLYTGNAHIQFGWNIHLLKELTPTLLTDDEILSNLQKCIDERLTIEVQVITFIIFYNFFLATEYYL